jgi:hypothetical protein
MQKEKLLDVMNSALDKGLQDATAHSAATARKTGANLFSF